MSEGWESTTQEDLSQKMEGGNKMAEQVKKT